MGPRTGADHRVHNDPYAPLTAGRAREEGEPSLKSTESHELWRRPRLPRLYVGLADGLDWDYNEPMQVGNVELMVNVPATLAVPGAAERARLLLILDAVRSERMTWRRAASELAIAPDQLLDLACRHGIPVVRYEEADWREDSSTLLRLLGSGGA